MLQPRMHLLALVPLLLLIACTPIASIPSTPIDTEPTATDPSMSTVAYRNQLSAPLTMQVGRAAHTATLLANGKVLLAGGFRPQGMSEIPIASAEIYDPATNTFTPTGDMHKARSGHTATLLPDGNVLIAGGWGVSQRHASAELYDAETGLFRATASMSGPRAGMTATLLNNGRVLLAGGEASRSEKQVVAELYDPITAQFTPTGMMATGRSAHTATLLDNGNVLFTGGNAKDYEVLRSAEIYDVVSGEFTPAGAMAVVRHKHAATLLQDGNVLVVGGSDEQDWLGQYASAEIYQTAQGLFTQTDALENERFKLSDALLLLDDGTVLVGGGHRQLEIFDAKSQLFTPSQALDTNYYYSVLTRLQDGSVLITGGYDTEIRPTTQAWIYQ